jgi:hypothetical protein
VDSSRRGLGRLVGSREHRTEITVSRRNFLEKLSDCQLLTKDFARRG